MSAMKKTCFIAINGIRTNPGDAEGWTDRFVTWINTRLPDGVVAEKFEYSCSALLRWLHQRRRADEISKKIGYYRRAGYRVVLVGHSNGGDLIARVMEACGVEIDAIHLIAPAAKSTAADLRATVLGHERDIAVLKAQRGGGGE